MKKRVISIAVTPMALAFNLMKDAFGGSMEGPGEMQFLAEGSPGKPVGSPTNAMKKSSSLKTGKGSSILPVNRRKESFGKPARLLNRESEGMNDPAESNRFLLENLIASHLREASSVPLLSGKKDDLLVFGGEEQPGESSKSKDAPSAFGSMLQRTGLSEAGKGPSEKNMRERARQSSGAAVYSRASKASTSSALLPEKEDMSAVKKKLDLIISLLQGSASRSAEARSRLSPLLEQESTASFFGLVPAQPAVSALKSKGKKPAERPSRISLLS